MDMTQPAGALGWWLPRCCSDVTAASRHTLLPTKLGTHARRNMDIIGVPGVAAEAELLAAIVLFHERLGLTSADVVIKARACTWRSLFWGRALHHGLIAAVVRLVVLLSYSELISISNNQGNFDHCMHDRRQVSSRRVLSAILARYGVPEASVGPVSVVVDKMEKIPLEKVRAVQGGCAGRGARPVASQACLCVRGSGRPVTRGQGHSRKVQGPFCVLSTRGSTRHRRVSIEMCEFLPARKQTARRVGAHHGFD